MASQQRIAYSSVEAPSSRAVSMDSLLKLCLTSSRKRKGVSWSNFQQDL